ncbi:carbohydrate kinase [Lentilitoribacter sp. Alg239-R112]|uniref:carbohydrate kinase family protein n=1 Tax=Lentilitoribacter sp. Alg239-R112 TaxID=2305987 RepID=UPI0013A708DB|nr:carbohydrate kinase [Lentilitoribacter sp. Alg239-R112]
MILCCGEALIDMIATDIGDGKQAFAPYCGGAIFNTAIALGRLDIDVGLLSGVSTDLFGKQLIKSLLESNVDVSPLIRSDRPTTLAFVQLENGHARYSFFDENSAGRMLTSYTLPENVDGYKACYFGGISLASEPCGDVYSDLAAHLAPDHIVMLDPNIRRSFIADEGRYRARLNKLMKMADIVKISDEDLNWIIPDNASLDVKLEHVKSLGPSIVILTKGEDGAIALYGNGQNVSVNGQAVEVVDTVGAGDTFNAGFLAKLSSLKLLEKSALQNIEQATLEEALSYAAKIAAVTVSRSGANPPWKNEL